MANSKTPEKRVLAAPVYDAIKVRIMEQDFRPGERLNIDALALELQVSPTPVREALARLAAERLLTFEAYKGYSVSPLLTPAEVSDLMRVRLLLEKESARLAASRINVPDLLAMEKALREHDSSKCGVWVGGYQKFNQYDQRFHETMVSAAGNPFLLEAWRSLNIHILLGRFYPVYQEQDQSDTCDEHLALLKALSDHNPEAAECAVENHLKASEIRVFKLIETHPHMFAGLTGS
jgi:DNA-binding GntR family transcriptional regulator